VEVIEKGKEKDWAIRVSKGKRIIALVDCMFLIFVMIFLFWGQIYA
jgi:hypothetical protein